MLCVMRPNKCAISSAEIACQLYGSATIEWLAMAFRISNLRLKGGLCDRIKLQFRRHKNWCTFIVLRGNRYARTPVTLEISSEVRVDQAFLVSFSDPLDRPQDKRARLQAQFATELPCGRPMNCETDPEIYAIFTTGISSA